MKILLTKLTNIQNDRQWREAVVGQLALHDQLSQQIQQQLAERDHLGSVQIAEQAVLPHIVNHQLTDSYFIVSQLDAPISYGDANHITTGIFILSRPEDPEISSAVDHLIDESVIMSLCNPQLNLEQLRGLLSS